MCVFKIRQLFQNGGNIIIQLYAIIYMIFETIVVRVKLS